MERELQEAGELRGKERELGRELEGERELERES